MFPLKNTIAVMLNNHVNKKIFSDNTDAHRKFFLLTYNDKRRGAVHASIVATLWMHGSNFKIKHAGVSGKIVAKILFTGHIECFHEIRIVVY